MIDVIIRKAVEADYSHVASLLQSASLPLEGVADHFHNFLVAEDGNDIVGVIGLEMYGGTALLRSAAVKANVRNTGIGSALYHRLVETAKSRGVQRFLLLTSTAEQYFTKKGWKKIDGQSVTGAIAKSAEFTGACPSHAVCMELRV